MKELLIKRLKDRHHKKMMKGEPFKISKHEGDEVEGMGLIVSPEKYSHITRTFNDGDDAMINLDADEIKANLKKDVTGGKVSKSHKSQKTWEGVQKVFKEVVPKKVSRAATNKITEQINDIPTYKGTPEERAEDKLLGSGLGHGLGHGLGGCGLESGYGLGGGMERRMNLEGRMHHATLENAKAIQDNAGLRKIGMMKKIQGNGLYVSAKGHGLGAGVGRSSVHSNLIYDNPNLRSAPFVANFQWANWLPPEYQQFNNGEAMYSH